MALSGIGNTARVLVAAYAQHVHHLDIDTAESIATTVMNRFGTSGVNVPVGIEILAAVDVAATAGTHR